MRFYDVNHGMISVDGIDIRQMERKKITGHLRNGIAGYLVYGCLSTILLFCVK